MISQVYIAIAAEYFDREFEILLIALILSLKLVRSMPTPNSILLFLSIKLHASKIHLTEF